MPLPPPPQQWHSWVHIWKWDILLQTAAAGCCCDTSTRHHSGNILNQSNCNIWLSDRKKMNGKGTRLWKRRATCSTKRRWSNCFLTFCSAAGHILIHLTPSFRQIPTATQIMSVSDCCIIKSNIYVKPRPSQYKEMPQIYHGSFCKSNRNSTSIKDRSCKSRHRWLIRRLICMDLQLKFQGIQMDESPCQRMPSEHSTSHFHEYSANASQTPLNFKLLFLILAFIVCLRHPGNTGRFLVVCSETRLHYLVEINGVSKNTIGQKGRLIILDSSTENKPPTI